jgi:beta-xylosidase
MIAAFIPRSLVVVFIPLLVWIYPGHTDRQSLKSQITKADTIKSGYANPIIPGDYPDPSVIHVGNTYYSSGTSSEWGPYFPLYKSSDLINWKQTGYLFKKKPEWAMSSFWAPELFYYNKTYYVFYVARRASDKVACIGVATATDPEKGFTDHGVLVDYGTESIDPFVIVDNGELYITWKAYGLDKRPIEILASKLSPDGLKRVGEPFSLLKDEGRKGMEGESLIKKNGYYYLIYSAGACCGVKCDYNVRVARSKIIRGPYENYEGNPILANNDVWKCPGHGTLVETAAHKYYYLYHAYNVKDNVYTGRIGMLDELVWDTKTGWPLFKGGNSPSVKAESPVKGTKQILENGLTDNFIKPVLNNFWQWDFRHSQPVIKTGDHKLYLSGKVDSVNQSGIALTVRPETGTYEMSTQVTNSNTALKGLVLYGDVDHALGIGVTGSTVQLWEVKGKQKSILDKTVLKAKGPISFKMTVQDKTIYKFYYSQQVGKWNELKEPNQSYGGKALPAWDRSPRPGLSYYGNSNERVAFSFFKVAYTK